jgi:hypothetical protein
MAEMSMRQRALSLALLGRSWSWRGVVEVVEEVLELARSSPSWRSMVMPRLVSGVRVAGFEALLSLSAMVWLIQGKD